MTGYDKGRTGADLYNLNALVHKHAPAVLGIPPGGGKWMSSMYPAGAPVIEIVGDHAAGKTKALDTLYEGYHRHVPTARVDLADAWYSAVDPMDRARLDKPNASPVTQLLIAISHELRKRPDLGSGPLSFPRLAPALLVITAWNPRPPEPASAEPAAPRADPWRMPPAEVAQAEEDLRRNLTAQRPDAQVRRGALERWLNALAGVVAGLLPSVPGMREILHLAIETLLDRTPDAPWLTWWPARLPGLAGDAVQRVFALAQDFHGPDRDQVEAHLIAALLADIDAAYNWWARRTQHPALILLDNVDDALRERFLSPFVREYSAVARRRSGRGQATRPAVFVTSLGNGSDRALTPVTVEAPWKSKERCPPHSWLLRMGIPRVSLGEVGGMLTGAGPLSVDVLHRLSGGRTGNALLLAEAARDGVRGAVRSEPGGILSLPSPRPESGRERDVAGRPAEEVAGRILEQLVPDPDLRDRLIDLSPALDEDAAAELWSSVLRDVPAGGPALAVRRLRDGTLALKHWQHRPWPTADGTAPLVTDRALRAVLLHRLRTQGGRERWTRIHRRLAAQYNTGMVRPPHSVEHEPRYLHHALALGQLDSLVVRAMHHRYLRLAPAAWLRDANLITAAPQAFDGFAGAEPPASLPPCPGCAHEESGKEVHAAIRTLLATVWRLSAPESEPPSGHRHPDLVQVSAALETLCRDYARRHAHGAAYNAYVDAAADRGWVDALLEKVQAPDLPVREESTR